MTPYEYAKLSYLAYEEVGKANLKLLQKWKIIDYSYNNKNGYFGVAFMQGKEIVIASRGTELYNIEDLNFAEFANSFKDVSNDFSLMLKKTPKQFFEASQFTDKIKKTYNDDYKITFTGHSLGGIISELLALKYNFDATTFDTIGASKVATNTFNHYTVKSSITQYSLVPNVINSFGENHLGKTIALSNITLPFKTPSMEDFCKYTGYFHSMERILGQFNPETGYPYFQQEFKSWPKSLLSAYTHFIDYRENKVMWDQHILKTWKEDLSSKKETLANYNKTFISKNLYYIENKFFHNIVAGGAKEIFDKTVAKISDTIIKMGGEFWDHINGEL